MRENTDKEIEIAVTFTDLSADERTLFDPYIDGSDLTVRPGCFLCRLRKTGTYHGMRLLNPDFVEVRQAGGKTDIRNKYDEIRQCAVFLSAQRTES